MDIDKLVMFLIMYDMCNDSGPKTKQDVIEMSQPKKKNIGNFKHYKATKSKHLQAFKRRL